MTVDPLTGDLSPVNVSRRGEHVQVQGRVIVTGLAITPTVKERPDDLDRYALTHMPSGLSVGGNHCGSHIHEIAKTAAESRIDWAADKDSLITELKATDGLIDALFGRGCMNWCEGDPPKPPTWGISCKTCDWEYDAGTDGLVTSKEQARQIGFDHECESWIELDAPGVEEATR